MNRRHFIRHAGLTGSALAAASAFPLLSGCAPTSALRPGMRHDYMAPDTSFTGSACGLPPVQVAEDRQIRTVVGLRPFRPSGFVVRAERLGDTLVFYNFLTLAALECVVVGNIRKTPLVDIGAPEHRRPITVLGQQVSLSNAQLLQEASVPAMTIYTKAMPPEQERQNISRRDQWFQRRSRRIHAKRTRGFRPAIYRGAPFYIVATNSRSQLAFRCTLDACYYLGQHGVQREQLRRRSQSAAAG